MIDHALGRPSPGWKRTQVILTTLALVYLIRRGDANQTVLTSTSRFYSWLYKRLGRPLDKYFRHARPWKVVLSTLTAMYVLNHALLLLFLNPPEPLAKMYTRNFFRATWIMTALDAGFLTAAKISPKWIRDLAGPLLSLVFLFFPESADNICRKYRYTATIDVMRTSWEKSTNPWLYLSTILDRGFLRIRENIVIPVPNPPPPSVFKNSTRFAPRTQIKARLYFDGTRAQLKKETRLIFHIHGGGFVTMSPRNHDDYVSAWARRVRVPILSIDYGKAPEFPYPWALEECFEAYRSVVESNGEVIGMEGWFVKDEQGRSLHKKKQIKIIVCGDSAGANLATGLVIKCIEELDGHVELPSSLILIYPCLSFDMTCWMPNNQLSLLRTDTNPSRQLSDIIRHKLMVRQDAPLSTTDAPRSIDVLHDRVDRTPSWYYRFRPRVFEPKKSVEIPSALSMTSRMTYFTDRIIQPEMIRGMAVMYLAGSPVVADVARDYKLSPVIAPDWILARFPKTYFLTGEKDPLVDDTVVFAARLRDAKMKGRREFEHQCQMMESMDDEVGDVHANGDEEDIGLTLGMNHVNGSKKVGERSSASVRSAKSVTPRPQRSHFSFTQEELETGFVPFLSHVSLDDMVHVKILEGMSHAFFNMMTFLPETKQAIHLVSHWFDESFCDESLSARWEDIISSGGFTVEDGGQQDLVNDDDVKVYPLYGKSYRVTISSPAQSGVVSNEEDEEEGEDVDGLRSYALYPVRGVSSQYEPVLRQHSRRPSVANDGSPLRQSALPMTSLNRQRLSIVSTTGISDTPTVTPSLEQPTVPTNMSVVHEKDILRKRQTELSASVFHKT